jgi:hypothetical protein
MLVKWGKLAGATLVSAQLGCGSPGAGERPGGAASSAPAASASAPTASASASAPGSARPLPTREGSAIARAVEGDALFVADEDHATVRVIGLPVEVKARRADLATPGRPAQVLALHGRVLVTIRQVDKGEGALLVLGRGPDLALTEIGRVTLPADAWGLAVTPDEGTAIVSSAWTHRVSAVDLRTLKVRWSVDVAREPRWIAVLPGGDRAYVSHLVGSGVTRIDGLADPAGAEPVVKRVALPAAPLRSPANVELPASLGYAAVASPSGDRVLFPRNALGALGPGRWFGVGAVDVLMTDTDTALAPARSPVLIASFTRRIAQAGTIHSPGRAPPCTARAPTPCSSPTRATIRWSSWTRWPWIPPS